MHSLLMIWWRLNTFTCRLFGGDVVHTLADQLVATECIQLLISLWRLVAFTCYQLLATECIQWKISWWRLSEFTGRSVGGDWLHSLAIIW
jgi:hypothetical protein